MHNLLATFPDLSETFATPHRPIRTEAGDDLPISATGRRTLAAVGR